MRKATFVWAHGLTSSVAQEDELGLFDWSGATDVAHIVRYDARGHGRSAPQYVERAYRWPALVDDMLRAAGDGPFVAGGASMGSATALFAATRAPRRVEALVLAVPPAAWEASSTRASEYESRARVVETGGLGSFVEVMRSQPQPPVFAEIPFARDVCMRHLRAMDEKALPAILRGAASSDFPTRAEIRQVIVPTLILAWTDDPLHPVSTAQALADLMLQAELHVASDLAATRTWPSLVRDFLGRVGQWEAADWPRDRP